MSGLEAEAVQVAEGARQASAGRNKLIMSPGPPGRRAINHGGKSMAWRVDNPETGMGWKDQGSGGAISEQTKWPLLFLTV